MTADTSNRTLVLSVVAVDLVGYSRKSVAEQMALKDNFNQVLLEAIRDIPVTDRIILDTGDGVAIGFLGDPEDALYVALFMHDAINRENTGKSSDGTFATAGVIRIGINLGPVKLATGVGGHPHIIGDGINVAERIMTFAEPGQFTASRPFFEVMSTLSEHYATLFQYAGVRTDNQVRSHDVYFVQKSVAAFEHAARGVAQRTAQRLATKAGPAAASFIVPPASSPQPAKVAEAPPSAPPELVERHPALIDFLEDRKKVATTATLLAVLAVALAALLIQRKMATSPTAEAMTVAAVSPANVDSTASVSSPPSAPIPAPVAATVPAKVAAPSAVLKTPAPATTVVPSKSSPVVAAPAVAPVAPVVTPASTQPTKNSERPSTPPVAAAAVPSAASPAPAAPTARDKPKDAKVERAELRDRITDKPTLREEIRTETRKVPPRNTDERKLPNTAPVVPTYQSSVQPPQPEVVAPTPTPPPAPVPDTRVVIVSRTDPSYPVEGIRQGILKLVIVKARVTIDARGGVTDVVILEGGPISAFGRETRVTLKQWKFNPGAAGRSLDIEISFKP